MNQNTNILEKEVKLWDRYEYALREENRILFREMLDKCRKNEYIDYVKSNDDKIHWSYYLKLDNNYGF